MRRFIIILTSVFLLTGCTRKEEAHPRPDISIADDSAAYIEMLEKEKEMLSGMKEEGVLNDEMKMYLQNPHKYEKQV